MYGMTCKHPDFAEFRTFGVELSGVRVQVVGYTRQSSRLVVFIFPIFETKTVSVNTCCSVTCGGEAVMLIFNELSDAALTPAIGKARSGRATANRIASNILDDINVTTAF